MRGPRLQRQGQALIIIVRRHYSGCSTTTTLLFQKGNLRKIILRHYLDAIINISGLFCYVPANLQLQRKVRRGRQVTRSFMFLI